jgi:hypothetical protein
MREVAESTWRRLRTPNGVSTGSTGDHEAVGGGSVVVLMRWSPSWEGIEALEREYAAVLVAKHELDSHERDKLAPEAWYE